MPVFVRVCLAVALVSLAGCASPGLPSQSLRSDLLLIGTVKFEREHGVFQRDAEEIWSAYTVTSADGTRLEFYAPGTSCGISKDPEQNYLLVLNKQPIYWQGSGETKIYRAWACIPVETELAREILRFAPRETVR